MALLLCIDTATETATIGLCNNNMTIASATNEEQKHHAAFVQPAVQSIMQSHSFSYNDIDAVAVVNGPGSYTGLRVGLASAKGICYASGKPLILLNTLEVMAAAAIERYGDLNALYCAVIDARRDEVFAGLYDAFLHPLLPPQPLRIDKNSFGFFLNDHKIFFFGSGHNKCGTFINHENAILSNISYSLPQINRLAQKQYTQKKFSDIAYAEPFYTKDFYSPGKQKGIF